MRKSLSISILLVLTWCSFAHSYTVGAPPTKIPPAFSSYAPDAGAADQGVTDTGAVTLKNLVDEIGTSKNATIIFSHSGGGNTTTYTLTTSETIPSNITTYIESGAVIDGAGTLTVNGPLEAGLIQCFGSSVTVAGLKKTYPEWWGIAGDDSTDDYAAFQAAINAAEVGGKHVFISTPSSKYKITDAITIDTANVKINGSGAGCIIRQATWGKPVFEVKADDIEVDGFYLQSTESKTVISGTYEGEPARGRSAGIYCADSSRFKFANIISDGFVIGIKLRGNTDGTSLEDDGVVNKLYAKNVDQGILWQQMRGLIIDVVQANTIALSQTGNPTHAVYSSGGASNVYSENVAVSNVTTKGNADGSAFQFKYCKRLTVNNFIAEDHKGLVDIIEKVEDMAMSNVVGYDMKASAVSNASFHITEMYRSRISNVYIHTEVGNQIGLSLLAGTDNEINGVTFKVDSATVTGTLVDLRGTRNDLINFKITYTDDDGKPFNVGATAVDCRIVNPRVENGTGAIFTITAGATDTSIDMNSQYIDRASGNNFSNGGTDTQVTDVNNNIQALANGAEPLVQGGMIWRTGGTTTITNFTTGFKGQIIKLISDHSITITDGTNIFLSGSANFVMTATDTLTLIKDPVDSKWYELARSDSGA